MAVAPQARRPSISTAPADPSRTASSSSTTRGRYGSGESSLPVDPIRPPSGLRQPGSRNTRNRHPATFSTVVLQRIQPVCCNAFDHDHATGAGFIGTLERRGVPVANRSWQPPDRVHRRPHRRCSTDSPPMWRRCSTPRSQARSRARLRHRTVVRARGRRLRSTPSSATSSRAGDAGMTMPPPLGGCPLPGRSGPRSACPSRWHHTPTTWTISSRPTRSPGFLV